MLLCCHPALSRPSQIALTLRAVAGLSTAQIARSFLVPEATMAQRISRAKARLAEEAEPFAPPPASELGTRIAAVAHVLYLVFTEGHAATAGAELTAPPLASEAIRLARVLHQLLPHEGEAGRPARPHVAHRCPASGSGRGRRFVRAAVGAGPQDVGRRSDRRGGGADRGNVARGTGGGRISSRPPSPRSMPSPSPPQ